MTGSARGILASGASELGIHLDEKQLDAFDVFTSLLLEWNKKFNLTRITSPEEIAVKHYIDSLALLKFVNIPSGSMLIDIGTGAGFPGIPLKIVRPDLKLTLLDSVRKKLVFLEVAVAEMGLKDVELIHGRAEDIGRVQSYRESYDFVVSRAVARLNVLAEFCLPFCRIGGIFAAYKGADISDEVKDAKNAIQILGGEEPIVNSFILPESDLSRTLVIVRKSRNTPAAYPRKAGIPERSPL
ncbi:MAG: 16S rRNA (guanine(527)-N(7))-methyltransferase RsmG [Armatimonadota bacterium]|nr:16S rRNA (guanine(527)-N(7))-methyltransferase RsmG [Armatimonadota bacterium]